MKTYVKPMIDMKKAGFILTVALAGIISIFCTAFKAVQEEPREKWVAPSSADRMVNPLKADSNTIAEAFGLYKRNCEQCHGQKGKGDGWQIQNVSQKIADIASPEIQKQSDGALYWKITSGNKPMPGMKKDLTETQRWKLVLYVRDLAKQAAK